MFFKGIIMKKKRLVAVIMTIFVIIMTVSVNTINIRAAELTDLQAYQAVFNAKYYAKNNPDVVMTYGTDANTLLVHYMNYGILEGRSASAEFNATAYRNRYSDLNALYGDNWVEYCRHYAQYGKKEGRNAKPDPAAMMAATVVPQKNADLNGYRLLGSYSTKYDYKVARATNVSLASARINGTVVKPGELFSYSNTILPRTAANGYVVAPVYINKKVGSGVGGGICQVSSTLYACMLTVGLPATERHPHSLPVHYLPEGMDATISGTTLDLKFINIYDKPLMITSSADTGLLTVSLWIKE